MSNPAYKIDLHTHSEASPDGGINSRQYKLAIDSGLLDYIAITDHNSVEIALRMRRDIGEKIIVGEEIMTSQGEVIGLYLDSGIEPGLSLRETIAKIKSQRGIVYVPHPFETYRKGIHPRVLDELKADIDIVEVCNGRAFLQNRGEQAVVWARINQIPGAASSDAHGYKGLGKTFTSVSSQPSRTNLVDLIASGRTITDRPGIRALLYPKLNKLKKAARRKP